MLINIYDGLPAIITDYHEIVKAGIKSTTSLSDNITAPFISDVVNARFYQVNGDLISSYRLYDKQSSFTSVVVPTSQINGFILEDFVALYHLWYAQLLYDIGAIHLANNHLQTAQLIARDQLIKHMVSVNGMIAPLDKPVIGFHTNHVVSELNELKKKGAVVPYLESLIMASDALIAHKNTCDARYLLEKTDDAILKEYPSYYQQIHFNKLRISQEPRSIDSIVNKLQKLVTSSSETFFKMRVLQEIAHYQSNAGQYDDAVESLLKAIQLTHFKFVSSLTVDHYLSIARIYDKKILNQVKAHHFYNLAYEIAIGMVSQGFPLSGARKFAIEDFMTFKDRRHISKQKKKAAIHQNILESKPKAKNRKSTNLFRNTHGKSFNEIIMDFKYNILAWGHKNSDGKTLHEFLGMSFANKNVFMSKLKKAGYDIPDLRTKGATFPDQFIDLNLQTYIESLNTSSWEMLIEKFDTDIIQYYYKKNKKVISQTAKELKLNQLTVRKRINKKSD